MIILSSKKSSSENKAVLVFDTWKDPEHAGASSVHADNPKTEPVKTNFSLSLLLRTTCKDPQCPPSG